ncbi:MAG: cysteine--tRNA ligase [Legionellales bacterium]|nr:cysteine--tRNA ligase [Legionellales bacterium]
MTRDIQLFDSKSKMKRLLTPRVPGVIDLYVCGMTVYDRCHLGHARVMVVFDMIVRVLRAIGYTVNYVRNITDIDDKIIKKAHESNRLWTEVVDQYIDAMHEDERALGVVPPNHEPRATEHIQSMIQMIQSLMDQGHAYVAEDGDVYFNVRSFDRYGELANQNLETLYHQARKSLSSAKHHALDFILWKQAKPGEPSWPSPWGEGRPGWHIECSAMSKALLGPSIDLHGGGIDLKFPHHENEIAQSECSAQCAFVNHWLHVGHVLIDDEKMSKSLGNFVTLDELFSLYHPEVIRYLLLSSHYRSPVHYTKELLIASQRSLSRLYGALKQVSATQIDQQACKPFYDALLDDFNVPQALSVCFKWAGEIFSASSRQVIDTGVVAANLKHCLGLLGLCQMDPASFLQDEHHLSIDVEVIHRAIADRNEARLNHDWATADAIRADLLAQGVVLEDVAGETIWRKA